LGGYVSEAVVVATMYSVERLSAYGIVGFTLGARHGVIIRSSQGWRAYLGVPSGRELVKRVAVLKAILDKAARANQHVHLVNLTVNSAYVSPF